MSSHYRNFKTVVYIPAWVSLGITTDGLKAGYDFIEKYIGLDKVYLETHRGDIDIAEDKLMMIKGFLEDKGVEVSGGITTIIERPGGKDDGKRRIFNTLCYTDPVTREALKQISIDAAKHFDEVILDDFYFTNCTCESCIKAKGDRDWVTFRRELMREVSKELIADPARSVNPKVKMVIKYPNWRESFHFTGYLPGDQEDIFDATYIGTETRSPTYADQHLPEYLSYSLVRFMDNAWPGKCGGGWFDTYQCWSIDRYLEQAYLTAFAGAKELMHFQWGDLIDNPFVCAMGLQLGRIDDMLEGTGRPVGIPVYIPHASGGENHLEMRLGMIGIPVEPTPFFPANAPKLLLTETALGDSDIIDKLVKYTEKGGDAVITTGFLREANDKLWKAGLTEARLTGKKFNVTRYHITGDEAGYIEHREPVLFPEIIHGNNESWSLLNGGDGDLHTSLFLRSTYGRGRIYVLSVPDNDADLYRLPKAVTDVFKRAFISPDNDTYISGRNISMFTYSDGSMIMYKYVKPDINPSHVTVHTSKKVDGLKDVVTGEVFKAREVRFREDFEPVTEYLVDITLAPGIIKKYVWVN